MLSADYSGWMVSEWHPKDVGAREWYFTGESGVFALFTRDLWFYIAQNMIPVLFAEYFIKTTGGSSKGSAKMLGIGARTWLFAAGSVLSHLLLHPFTVAHHHYLLQPMRPVYQFTSTLDALTKLWRLNPAYLFFGLSETLFSSVYGIFIYMEVAPRLQSVMAAGIDALVSLKERYFPRPQNKPVFLDGNRIFKALALYFLNPIPSILLAHPMIALATQAMSRTPIFAANPSYCLKDLRDNSLRQHLLSIWYKAGVFGFYRGAAVNYIVFLLKDFVIKHTSRWNNVANAHLPFPRLAFSYIPLSIAFFAALHQMRALRSPTNPSNAVFDQAVAQLLQLPLLSSPSL